MYNDTPLWMVDDAKNLADVADRLARAPAIGVDTESDSFYSYKEKVCLIQITDLERDYIIDPLAIDDLSVLAPIMSDPGIVKIMHGADYDVVCMKRDFDYTFHNLFDTMVASQLLGLPKIGFADLVGRFFGVTIEKKYQRHDWGRRPLKDEHIQYARGDSHWLPALREILMRRLKKRGRYLALKEECEILEQREWTPKPFDPDGYLGMKGAGKLNDQELRILRRFYLYREEQAQKLDRPLFKVIGDRHLVKVARGKPTSRKELDKVLPGKRGLKRRHANNLIDLVKKGLDDDFEVPSRHRRRKKKKKRRPRPPRRLRGRQADRALSALKSWRNELVGNNPRLTPVGTMSNAVMKQVARRRPLTHEEMETVKDVRRWQVREFGDRILEILDEVAPWSDDDEAKYQRKLQNWIAKHGDPPWDEDDDDEE